MVGNTGTINIRLKVRDDGSVKILDQVGIAADKAGKQGQKSFEDMGRSSKKMSKSIDGVSAALVKMGAAAVAALAVGAALDKAISATIKMGMKFESTMKTVQAVSGATSSEYAKLSAAARLMGATTEWSASQAAEALKYLSMAGLDVQSSIQALPGMLDLATAAQMDLGEASDIVTDTLTAFGMKTSELTRLSDAFINTSTKSNTTVQMLGESFKYVAPVAAQFGYDVEQTSAFLGVLANSGIKASMAGTSLSSVMLDTGKAAKALGMDAGSNLNAVLKEMHDRQMDANEVTKMFGKESAKTALVLMNNVDAVAKLNEELVNTQGAAEKTAAIMRGSTENMKATFFSAMEEVSLSMYDVFEDDLRDALAIATQMMGDNAEVFVDWATKLSTAAAATYKVFIVGAGVVSDTLIAMSLVWDGLKIPILAMATYVNEAFLTVLKSIQPVVNFFGGPLAEMVELSISQIAESQKYLVAETKKTLDHFTKLSSGGSKALNALNLVLGESKEATEKVTKAIVDQGKEHVETQETIRGEIDATAEANKKALEAFDRLYERFLKETVKVTEESLKQQAEVFQKAGADKVKVAEWLNHELEKLYDADAMAAKKAEDERLRAAQQAAKDRAGAYRDMYRDMGKSSDDYYKYEAELLKKQRDDYAALTGDRKLADAWFASQLGELLDSSSFDGQSFGNAIAEGINNAVSSMGEFNSMLDDQVSKQKVIDQLRKDANMIEDIEEREKHLKMLSDREAGMVRDQVAGYRHMFGTTAQMFKANSKERQIMHNAEMAFAVLEIGMNLQKSISNAVASVTAAGQGDPYTAIPRVIAMAALMGGILSQVGGSISGGSGSSVPVKAENVTGSVLGFSGQASESLANVEKFFNDIHVEEYAELQGIHNQMKSLNSNITGLVSNLFRGGVGFTPGDMGIDISDRMGSAEKFSRDIVIDTFKGIKVLDPISQWVGGWISKGIGSVFGGKVSSNVTSQGITAGGMSISDLMSGGQMDAQSYADISYKKKGGWFRSDKRWSETQYQDLDESVDRMFTQIFKGLGETFKNVGELVGKDLAEIGAFEFDIGKIDLKNLETADEINAALSAALSGISDNAATVLFGELIGQYQKTGEGMMETAVRVASEKIIVVETLDKLGNAFGDADIPALAIEFSQSLLDIVGGLESFMESTSQYYDKFFTDEEKQANRLKNLSGSLGNVNIKLPDTREAFRELVEGIDLTDDAGKKAFVTLMNMSDMADEVFSYMEKTTKNITDGMDNLFVASGRLTDENIFKREFVSKYGVLPSIEHSKEALDFLLTATEETIQGLAEEFGVTVPEMFKDLAREAELAAEAISDSRDALDRAITKERQLIAARLSAANQIDSLLINLRGGSQAPVQSMEFFEKRYEQLLSDARAAETPEEITSSINALTGFASQYLDFAQAYGSDYKTVFNTVTSGLEELSSAYRIAASQQETELSRIENILGATQETVLSIDAALSNYLSAIERRDNATPIYDEVMQLYATVGRVGIGDKAHNVDQEGYDYWTNSGLSGDALRTAFWNAVDQDHTDYTRQYVQDMYGPGGMSFAEGGIASGPRTGYPVTLHGTEAVVPLSSGSIPVRIQGGGNQDIKVIVKIGNKELTDITTEVIRTNPEAQTQIRRVANG